MNLLKRIFIVLAVACGAAWLAKMAAIAANGGAGSTLVAALWAIGMITFLLAAGTGTALLLGRAPVWARLVAGVLAARAGVLAARPARPCDQERLCLRQMVP